MRLILFTGAGGAGVTTLAAATALAATESASGVCLVSADAPSLSAVLGDEHERPPGLHLASTKPDAVFGEPASDVIAWIQELLGWAGLDPALAGDAAALSVARLVAVLLRAVAEPRHAVVADLGAADAVLPVLQLLAAEPDGTGNGESIGRQAARLAGPLLSRLVDVPRPGTAVRGAGRRAGERLGRLRAAIRDPAVTSVRVVVPADGRAPRLARESLTVCRLHGIGIDALICRGQAPDGSEREPVLPAPISTEPARGSDGLLRLGLEVYGRRDAGEVLAEPRGPRIELTEGGADLVLSIPPWPPGELRVARAGSRLTVNAGPWRRMLTLPPALRSHTGRRAWHDGDSFRIRFER